MGLSLELPPFGLDLVQELALRYGLAIDDDELQQLLTLVGGHPYLTQLTLFHLTQQQSLTTIAEQAIAYDGIYSSHLRQQTENLEGEPDLIEAMAQVAQSPAGVKLPPQVAFRLQGLGLIRFRQQLSVASCELYRQFFATLLEK